MRYVYRFTGKFAAQIFSEKYFIMKTYEILSKTREGKLVAVVSTEAKDVTDAMRQTANFCDMMDIEVHSIRRNTRREKK